MSEFMGALFKNDYKKEGTQQPDFKGTVRTGQGEIKLVGWFGKDKNGKQYINFKADKPKAESAPRKDDPKFQEDADIPW